MRTIETNLVTMRDIANLAGVSPGTVSRALKNQTGLTEQTRQLILRCASELGYNALNLRSNKLKRVGFVTSRLPNLTINPFYAPILHGVEDACHDEEIALSYISLRPGDRVSEIVRRHEADGLLCVGHLEPKLLERIAALGLPFVLIDHWSAGIASVNIDNLGGAKQAAQHLVQNGYKRIAFIGDSAQYPIKTRLFSFRRTLYEQGILSDPTLEISPETPYTRAGTKAAVHDLLKLQARPDAFFIPNDESALWAIQICLDAGLRVPEDIAIVGFDDIYAASHANPALTTVRVDKEMLGRSGLELLLSRSRAEIVIETELIVRGSTVIKSQAA
jgi:LacI family transcriptional regulator, repressor for deo operon, udp, cdd, tsx, nupC, and nupG